MILEFETPEEFENFFNESDQNGYFELPPYGIPDNVIFRARACGSPRMRKIRPVRIAVTGEACIVYLSQSPTKESGALRSVELKPGALDAVESSSTDGSVDPVDSATAEVGRSLFDQIRALTVTQRVTLALKADLMQRRILMQENNSKINEFLLRNVRITEQEIAFMARNPALPMQNLLAIAGNKPWMNHESIRSAILTNPRTPATMVLDMIPMLSPPDLLKMHHAGYVREDVKAAVRRELKKRGIKIRENL